MPTHALTIRHPWLWCILHSDKRIENRSRKPPSKHVGTRVYLHSSKQFDHKGAEFCREVGVELPDEYNFGCLEGSAVLAGTTDYCDDPWYQGPVGWRLDEVRSLKHPQPHRGQLGIWKVKK